MRVSNCLILFLLVLYGSSQVEAFICLYQSPRSELILFLRGLSNGFTGEDFGADLGKCLGEGEQLINDVQEAMADIEKGSSDLTAVEDGIFKLTQVISEVSMAS